MNPLSLDRMITFTDDHSDLANAEAVQHKPGLQMGLSKGHCVCSFIDLLRKIATLTYWNPRFRLLFRGQSEDYNMYTDDAPPPRSSLYPKILRGNHNLSDWNATLDQRFAMLQRAEGVLKRKLTIAKVHRDRAVQWALLQHYEVCPTPFLDLTSSLQTAISFALKEHGTRGFLYVFAFPQLTGPISVSVESETFVVDLSQVCPPEALRPHLQHGFLACDYPLYASREETHGRRGAMGNSFVCRLLAKFHLTECQLWSKEGFTLTPDSILFPNNNDEWYGLLKSVKEEIAAAGA